jgi:hypothetical protein
LSRCRSSQLVSTVPSSVWRFDWRNGRTGLGLPHGQPHGEDPQVARAREEVLARDESDLGGWQSGVLWADGTTKGSFGSLASVVADANKGTISCAAPTAPNGLAAGSSGDPAQVNLSWGPGASQIGVSGYEIVRDGVSIGRTTGLTFTDPTAAPGTTYSYSVRGYDAAGGIGDLSAAVSVTLPASPPPPPPAT